MIKKKKINCTILFLIIIGTIVGCRQNSNTEKTTTTVQKRTLTEDLIFSARVLPSNISNYLAIFSGELESVKKIPGQSVKKGDVIVVIKDNGTRHEMEAKENGTLLSVQYSIGESINSNSPKPVFSIGDISKLIIDTDLDEIDAGRIKAGFPLLAYAKNSFSVNGTVDYINIVATQINNVLKFKMTGTLIDSTASINQFGNTIPIKVILNKANDIPSIENNYLLKKDDKMFIMVKTDKGTIEKEVKTGIETDKYTELKQGASVGDIIYLP